MSKHSRPQDSTILGESWVIASAQLAEGPSASNNKKINNNHQTEASDTTPRPTRSHHENLTESISTSCESISGPDLIMPSIYETPICEGSWIAPTASPQRALRRRHQASSPSPTRNSTQRSSAKVTESAPPTVAQHETINRRPSFTLPSRGFILRILLNVLLIAGISHLLILPEIIQQHQSLCSLPALATLYPTSCIPLYLKPNHINNNRLASISTQTPLETLLNNTLRTMAPHSTTLKHTESKLRDIHQLLKKQYPGSKHELDLEFSGCLEATRTATRRFDSLHADLRSAVDSLIAARGSGSGSGRGSAAPAAATTANTSPDARLSTTQLTRREQYVDQLTSRMQTKADSLLGDFATLDDHLESIAGVVKRETNRLARRGNDDHHLQGSGSSSSSGLKGMVGALFGGGSARSQPHTNNKDNENNDSNDHHHHDGEDHHSPQPPASSSHPHQHHNYPQLPTLFQEAATRHQPVMDVIKKLSDGLQRLQNKKGGMFHS
ncbi:uncharacterized protein BO66DRAFT_468959 [Aspergillus aculeatinus CBS 121060]|uniref:Uncharacterized protein n=1 Tax=Aspergillus aculeatinus CBS 121060 TaxID=1448322 RepID=A0ACD1HHX0_9EURO|nr:hypothetical protein BO66DRAFT_468959 [Aspergillus aculeatinus CBS 121060]RAH73166.1 hypothetical protein BO66DRAFT_468959 [Aspergillus aculeatinus CBS 121060]